MSVLSNNHEVDMGLTKFWKCRHELGKGWVRFLASLEMTGMGDVSGAAGISKAAGISGVGAIYADTPAGCIHR